MRVGPVETITTAESPMQVDKICQDHKVSNPNNAVAFTDDSKDSDAETLYERGTEFLANVFLIFDGQSDR